VRPFGRAACVQRDLPWVSVRNLLILLEVMGCCYGRDSDGPAKRENAER
jgi:hypothetical protein